MNDMLSNSPTLPARPIARRQRPLSGNLHGQLQILATTDLHMDLTDYDYFADRPGSGRGLRQLAQMIGALRAEARAQGAQSLLLDNGDLLQGSPMADYMARPSHVGPHPAIIAMNALGYDAATLGNHDFDFGLGFLRRTLSAAEFPFLSSNLELDNPGPILRQSVLTRSYRDQNGATRLLRIGILGFLPPQTARWESHHLGLQARITPILESARRAVPALRDGRDGQPGCDIVLVLAHSGIGPAAREHNGENVARALAGIEGVDALICGHTHMVFPSPGFAPAPGIDPVAGRIDGKPTVMAGARGSHLGVIDLELCHRPGTGWQIRASRARALAVGSSTAPKTAAEGVAMAAKLDSLLAPHHAATLDFIRRPLGHSAVPLNSFFALLRPDPALALIAEAQRNYMRAQGVLPVDTPLLVAVTPFRAGGRAGPGHYTNIAPGPLTNRSIADLYAYADPIHAVRITGAELREWLERAASIFHRIVPGRTDQPLLDPDYPAYKFDVIDGLDYEIDLSAPQRYGPSGEMINPKAHRIGTLHHRGRILRDADRYVLIASSFRLLDAALPPERVLFAGQDRARDVLTQYVREAGSLRPQAHSHWRFAPLPGSSVLFDSAPEAEAHLPQAGLALEPLGLTPQGFARFRLPL